jgi:carboxymethylenebutenolidase
MPRPVSLVRTTAALAAALLGPALSAGAQADPRGAHDGGAVRIQAQASAPALPPDAESAKAALERSPRHGEYVDIKVSGMTTPLTAWVVYPERKTKAPVVIVIHEIFGLTDWIRAVADQLAAEGFIAIAPDLLSGRGPGGGGTPAFSGDEVTKAIRSLRPEEVTAMLDAVREYGAKLPASNGRVGTIGFCWGGSTSFRYATEQPALGAAVVYYGSAPDTAALARVQAPILGLFAGDDARVNATIPAAEAELKRLGRLVEVHTYEGAGHGFLRQQGGRDGANRRASEQAWPTTIAFLRRHLERGT